MGISKELFHGENPSDFSSSGPSGVGEEDVQEHHLLGDEVITDQPHNEMEEGHLAEEVKILPLKHSSLIGSVYSRWNDSSCSQAQTKNNDLESKEQSLC